jgi:hypothetical protein
MMDNIRYAIIILALSNICSFITHGNSNIVIKDIATIIGLFLSISSIFVILLIDSEKAGEIGKSQQGTIRSAKAMDGCH